MHTFKENHPECPECKGSCDYIWTPTVPQVAFKDGASSGWPSKANHFSNYRRQRSEEMAKRQRDRYGDVSKGSIPNYNGVEAPTWADARSEALRNGGSESAATYNAKVEKENKDSKKIVITRKI